MKLLRNDVDNLFNNTHVQIKLFWDFYHGIIYIANEGRHVRIDIWYIHYVWPLSFGHCITCPFTNYDFWLPLSYLQTFHPLRTSLQTNKLSWSQQEGKQEDAVGILLTRPLIYFGSGGCWLFLKHNVLKYRNEFIHFGFIF